MSDSEYVPSEFCKQYSDSSDESVSHQAPRPIHEIVFEHNVKTYSWSFVKTKPWRSGKACKEWITEFLRTKTPREIGACLYYHVNNDSTMEVSLTNLAGKEIEDSSRVYTSAESTTILQIKWEKTVESPKKRRRM